MRFLTSDHHFGHANIIEYTDRPFSTLSDMEWSMVDRWNEVVSEDDVVFHVGDMCYQTRTHHSYWTDLLNGSLVLVRGNHDYFDGWDDGELSFPVVEDCLIRAENGVELYLRHHDEPWDGSGGWLVHGHVHEERPALDRDRNMINVCVEKSDYYPIPVSEIANEIYSGSGNREFWDTNER